MNIATILTCHNRKEKTVKCLQHLFVAEESYNKDATEKINLSIYLTDDGCTDGTVEAVKNVCNGHNLHIIQGDGNCYWAGGMRLAWSEALKQKDIWQFYLLMNDDTYVNKECFFFLLEAHQYCITKYEKPGIYSGITCDTADHNQTTYGGRIWTNFLLGKDQILHPTGKPQKCDMANSNIMLIVSSVVDRIGIFWDAFDHSCADYDYSMKAIRKGVPVVVTSNVCGECEYDHPDGEGMKSKELGMTLRQRIDYFNNPLHSYKDQLRLKRRNTPLRWPFGLFGSILRIYLPHIYYLLSDARNKTK